MPIDPCVMKPVHVRQMELSDCEEASVLVCRSYEWAGRREGISDTEIDRYVHGRGSPETIRGDLVPGRSWVAIQADRIVGVIMTHDNQIGKLYVEPSSVGRGIGKRLFREAEETIARNGHDDLELWAVFDSAIPFYRAMGLQCEGRKFDLPKVAHTGRNTTLMTKRVTADCRNA